MRFAMLTAALLATIPPAAAQIVNYPDRKDTDPTVMIGMSVGLGSTDIAREIGFTVKGLSTNAQDHFTFGGGVGYYPWSEQALGLDLGVGYNFTQMGIFGSYDLLRRQPVISAGYVPTVNDKLQCPFNLRLLKDGTCGSPPP